MSMIYIVEDDDNIRQLVSTALQAFGYEKPKFALLSLVEKVTFHMQDTVEAQRLVAEQKSKPFADCQLWGPIAYDLILSKEAARLKNYDCPWSGGGFDGIIAPDLSTANTLVKSWLIHAHAVIHDADFQISLCAAGLHKDPAFPALGLDPVDIGILHNGLQDQLGNHQRIQVVCQHFKLDISLNPAV